jgi:hypothetical protein
MPGWCPRHGRCCAAASALRQLLLYGADLLFESLAPLTEFEEFAVRQRMPAGCPACSSTHEIGHRGAARRRGPAGPVRISIPHRSMHRTYYELFAVQLGDQLVDAFGAA